ncbi:hypothetical protein QBC35DRAFT_233767 [Podospora australis]|uniref:FAD-dependent oxidoreductase-like enzyme n=1 Tax=Podospora australis TaxID=1536484 RepID=A0AAN6WWD7_9PEZI|nr:hypothetical protein QBC35DRAFT_233767 [Podospora australis]
MLSSLEQSSQLAVVNGTHDANGPSLIVDAPATPQDEDSTPVSSQQSMPPTETANSPRLDPSSSFKSDLNDDLDAQSVIPSSLTPPPSSQMPPVAGAGVVNPLAFIGSQRSGFVSPPETGLIGVKRDDVAPGFATPTQQQINDASTDEVRNMLQTLIAEHSRLKMQAAHHRMQNVLLTMQAEEDANRAAVEHEMTKREVEALQQAECQRQARRDITVATESAQARYLRLEMMYKDVVEENQVLNQRLKGARKVLEERADEIESLKEDREVLLTRIRENREHFHLLCSPGGIFHGAMTPKVQSQSPQQPRATPRQTPRSAQRDAHHPDHGQRGFAVLLEALSQDNNSAPSTPISGLRPGNRAAPRHTRNVQSMSSLPTTPVGRARADTGGLLPSVDLVPQTEPPHRHSQSRFFPETPISSKSRERRRSRESTISAEEDNEELARQALKSIATTSSFASRGSQSARSSRRRPSGEMEEVYESQASQRASEMLRRDPRESFEVASSVNSRDGTPTATDKSAKLQAKIFGPLNKGGLAPSGKRKFGEAVEGFSMREQLANPTKKLREAGGLRGDPSRVGLGIQYSRDA